MKLSLYIFPLLLCCYQMVRRGSSIPSIIRSSVFEREVTVVSYAQWSSEQITKSSSWLTSVLDVQGIAMLQQPATHCALSIAVVGIHTHRTGEHLYKDLCSNHTFEMQYHPRKHISEVSYYLKGKRKFLPVLDILPGTQHHVQMNCSYFRWSIGVGYAICPLEKRNCELVDTANVDMTIRSQRSADGRCINPLNVNFTTQAASLRRKMHPPVSLSICIYSGFRPHENTRFYDMLEANIEYHRRLGVQRFYILDRNSSHANMFKKHHKDWIETGLVVPVQTTVGELLNPSTMQIGGFRDQVVSLPLCTHEYPHDRWMLTLDKDEFFTCDRSIRQRFQSDGSHDNLALNFVANIQSDPDITHVYLLRLNRGPKVNKSRDCIDGGYPTKGKSEQEISLMDWKMNRKVHHRYYEKSSKENLLEWNITLFHEDSNQANIYSPAMLYASYFKEFSALKTNTPSLGKVIQKSSQFPFTDIHGWSESKQNDPKVKLLKIIKKTFDMPKGSKGCFLWHFNPKWDSYFRGVCKGIHTLQDVEETEVFPKFKESNQYSMDIQIYSSRSII